LPWRRQSVVSEDEVELEDPVSRPQLATVRRSGRSLRWPLAILGLLGVSLAGLVAVRTLGVSLVRPSIVLTPPAPPNELQTIKGLVIPVSGGPVDGTAASAVEAAIIEQPVSVAVQGQAISTTTTPIGRATGTLIVRNTLSQPVVVRAGTIVPATNGIRFTVDADVTVPEAVASADGIDFGRGQVKLTATVPGAAGNLPPNAIRSIPGLEGTLRVIQGEFIGGSDVEVRVVRTEEVNRVLPDALSRFYGAGVQALEAAVAGTPELSPTLVAITPTLETLKQLQGVEYAVFPPIGSVTRDGTFRLEVRATFRAAAEPVNRPLREQIEQATRNQLVSTAGVSADAEVAVAGWTIAGQGLVVDATVRPTGKAPPLPPDLLAEVQKTIVGMPRDAARAYLESLVARGRIAAFTPIPDQWETIPEQVSVKQATGNAD